MDKNNNHTNSDEAQSYLAAIIESSDDAIVSKDLNGNIRTWNSSAERIFGYTAEEAIGRHISIIIPHDKFPEEEYILGMIRQGKRVTHFETLRRTKKGSLVDISVTVSPIRNSEGVVIGASKIARDITMIKLAERESAYLAAIIESSDDAIISKDLNGFITSWNKAAERIFGYTAEEVVGKHITVIIPPERLHEEDTILTTLKDGKRVDHYETLRRHKSGELVPVSLTVSPIFDSAGNIIGASKTSRDISFRIKAEEALNESNRKKDEFLANMSHELRTPMNAVIGIANLLSSMPSMPEASIKLIQTLKLSADNLMDLINDLLDFTKIEAGLLQIENIEFNLGAELEKIISLTNVRIREKKLDLYVNCAPDLKGNFIGDPLRIHQVLVNIISNATKFTENGRIEIDISGKPQEGKNTTDIRFQIKDTGIGIPADKLDSIFEKFSQADSSITRKYGGSGLGLAITKALVERMNGTIEVQSQINVGTSFIVTIPFENGQGPDIPLIISSPSAAEPLSERKNVLLVEDYEPNILVATTMLKQFGFNFETAHNGYEALRKFSEGRYDVILMDVQMPDLDGLETTRRIRSIENQKALARTPIIAMTAHAREQDRDRCLDAGMDDYIAKPFDPNDLQKKVEKYAKPF